MIILPRQARDRHKGIPRKIPSIYAGGAGQQLWERKRAARGREHGGRTARPPQHLVRSPPVFVRAAVVFPDEHQPFAKTRSGQTFIQTESDREVLVIVEQDGVFGLQVEC